MHVKDMLSKKYAAAVVCIVVLAIAFSVLASGMRGERTQQASDADQTQSEEERLEQILSSIDGAGQVQVMITYAAVNRSEPAAQSDIDHSEQSTAGTQSHTDSAYAQMAWTQQHSAQAAQEVSTQIRGVVVIAQGAEDIAVKMDLLQATVTVLQVDESQVDVFVMREE